jgi:uncharacterized protein (TIGR03118 family)
MRQSIRDLQHNVLNRSHKRRSRDRRPAVEGLENRALMSAAHELIGHEHFALAAKKAKTVSGFQQTNLVSDIAGMAQVTDSNLVNPWGISFSSAAPKGSPIWVSDQGTGKSTLYAVNPSDTVTKNSLIVTIPTVGSSSPTGPTGQVANSTREITVPTTTGCVASSFIFDTLQGTIEGWNPGSVGGMNTAVIVVNNSSTAQYTGLAAGSSGGVNYLYAANDLTSPGVEVYNGSFARVTLAGNFHDPKLPKGFVPYNIVNVNGDLFVTYRGPKFKGGAVAEFNTNGTFVRQIAANKTSGNLQSPWGVALAPFGFGKFSNDLIVGNFSSGLIDAYTSKGKFAGQLTTPAKKKIKIPGLWTLTPGNGLQAGPADSLLFTAGDRWSSTWALGHVPGRHCDQEVIARRFQTPMIPGVPGSRHP